MSNYIFKIREVANCMHKRNNSLHFPHFNEEFYLISYVNAKTTIYNYYKTRVFNIY